MEEIEKRVVAMFLPGVELFDIYRNYHDEEYIKILDSVDDFHWFSGKPSHYSWCAFLYSGCLTFNRWTALLPFVKSDILATFRRFVEASNRAEKGVSDNTPMFLLQEIRSEIFTSFDGIPLESIELRKVGIFLDKIAAINSPNNTEKNTEFLREKEKNLTLISGLLGGKIQTKITTHLPYIVHQSTLSITSSWQGISIKSKLTPTFLQSESLVSSNIPNQPISPSRWQAGITKVELEFQCLIDYDAWTPSLLELGSEPLPFDGWAKGFTLAFQVIDDLVWRVRIEYGGESQWIPAPRDISASTFEILSDGQRVAWKLKEAAFMRMFPKTEEELEIELGQLQSIPWYIKCRSLAVMYLEIGETNEALFWLNAGIESLFQNRFKEIALATGRTNLEDELNSPNVYWNDAEEIVKKQFPELAGKIEWPDSKSHVSLYKKLKCLHTSVPMKTSVKELTAKYNKISKHRNPLFHGVREERLPANVVKEALSSFDWINENFVLSQDNSCT